MRSGNSPGRIFCIIRPFALLHSQEFAREGGHAPFLASSLPFPADNAIERLARRSSLTVHQKTGQPLGRPVFLFIDKQNRRSRSFDFSCLAEKSKSGVPVTLPEALLFIRSVFRTEPPKFSHGSLRRADAAAGPQAQHRRLHSPNNRYPASDRCRPALQTAPR